MNFQIPDMTALLVVVVVAVAMVGAILVALVVDALRDNRRTRLARHERVLPYYGHLVLGH